MDSGSESLHVESSTLRGVGLSPYVESKPKYLSAATKFNSNSNNYRFNVEIRQRALQSASLSPQLLPINHKSSYNNLLLKLIEDSVLSRCRLLLSVEGRSRSPSDRNSDAEESPQTRDPHKSAEPSNTGISAQAEAAKEKVGGEKPKGALAEQSFQLSRNQREASRAGSDIGPMPEEPGEGSAVLREATDLACSDGQPGDSPDPASTLEWLAAGNGLNRPVVSDSQEQLLQSVSAASSFIDILGDFVRTGRVFPTGLLLAFLRTELARGVDPILFSLLEYQIERLDAQSADQIAEALLPHLDWLQDSASSESLVTGFICKKNCLLLQKFEQLNRNKPTQLFVKRTRRKVFLRYLMEVACPDQKKFLALLLDRLQSNRSDLRYLLKRRESVWLLMATFCRWIRFGEIKSLKKLSQKIRAIQRSDPSIGASSSVAVSSECLNELLHLNYCRVLEILSSTASLYNAVSL